MSEPSDERISLKPADDDAVVKTPTIAPATGWLILVGDGFHNFVVSEREELRVLISPHLFSDRMASH